MVSTTTLLVMVYFVVEGINDGTVKCVPVISHKK